MTKSVFTRLLPPQVVARLRPWYATLRSLQGQVALSAMHEKMLSRDWKGTLQPLLEYTVRINDGPNFYILYKDIFLHRIYHFDSLQPAPRIIDCGSNIGVSILYFKYIHPAARIIGFEPDPTILPYLQENLKRNGITDIEIVQAGVAAKEGVLTFYSDASYGTTMEKPPVQGDKVHWQEYQLPCVRLYDYLNEPTDFLKMNIEGAEWEVLDDCRERLHQVNQMAIEYHHLPGLERNLHKILALLDEQGFEYVIYDFDAETNGEIVPPFSLAPGTRYYLLIYAKRLK